MSWFQAWPKCRIIESLLTPNDEIKNQRARSALVKIVRLFSDGLTILADGSDPTYKIYSTGL